MTGKHRIIVQNKRVRYDFTIRRNLTIIKGDSATGKTTLVDMIGESIDNPSDTSIELVCDKACYVVSGATWKGQIQSIRDSIIFIDEGNEFVASTDFAETVRDSDNYYVLVTRQDLPVLPYSVDEIYGIRNSGKYGGLKRTYNEFYRIYTEQYSEKVRPECIITEDSNSGFQFFEGLAEQSPDMKCLSANGKAKVFAAALKANGCTLIIADGAAFGPEMDKVFQLSKQKNNLILFLPESFEWMILNAGVIQTGQSQTVPVTEILEHPEDFIESRKYFSWERYFTALLTETTQDTYLQYNKSRLNPAYLGGKIPQRIIALLEKASIEIE